jgi:FkbM family methyltransferase
MNSVTLPDDHGQAITLMLKQLFKALPKNFSLNTDKTVIHVGAHTGEEVPFYFRSGFNNICLVEANPDLVAKLTVDFDHVPEVKVVHRAISNVKGIAEFTIHQTEKGSVESASLLELKRLGEIVQVFNSNRKVQVATSTLDELVDEMDVTLNNSLLCLDIQGAELMALEGAEVLLSKVNAVICEVNLIENYKDGALEHEIEKLLTNRGFVRYFTIYHELYEGDRCFPAWGEGLWIKK